MASQSSPFLMAPYGNLCSEKYLNFTEQYSSPRFVIFVLLFHEFLGPNRCFPFKCISMFETTLWVAVNHEHRDHCYFVCCLYTPNLFFQLQDVIFLYFSFMHNLNVRIIWRLSASILQCRAYCDRQDDAQNARTVLHKLTYEMLF